MKVLIYYFLYHLREIRLKVTIYKQLNVFLPMGAAIHYPQNIRIGKKFTLGPGCQILCQDPENGSRIIIGDSVALNSHVILNADRGGVIRIGDNVIIGPMSTLRAANHRFHRLDKPIREQGHRPGTITIEEGAWLGAGVIILPDVTIGKSSIVGAGSVVTKSVPPYFIAGGNPAKPIRSRSTSDTPH